MSADHKAVGIDLGTTNCVVAHLDEDVRPATVTNSDGDRTTPSVVFFDRHGPVVGKEAQKAAMFDPGRAAQFVKRDMGHRQYHRAIAGKHLPPEVIEAVILKKLRQDAAIALGEIDAAVVTVPAYFNEPRRKATQDAGRLAGLEVLDIINEPTAAAIAYGIHEGFIDADGQTVRRERVLVYDLGGGTFDATLMEIDGGNYTTLATAGDVHLGGIDFNRRILDHVAEVFREEFGADPREDPVALQELFVEAEDAKRALSARDDVTVHFKHEGGRLQLALSREEFETLSADLIERTLFTVKRLLNDARLKPDDVSRILLVGGSTRMPMVRESLGREFSMPLDRSLSPDEAVAHGAAQYAAFVLARRASKPCSVSVVNVNSHDLGVQAFEGSTERSRRKVQIPRNTPLPARGEHRFFTQRDDQRTVCIPIIEGGDASGRNATAIGRCYIRELPPGLPSRTPIDVVFHYGEDGRLTVEGELPSVGRKATLVIKRAAGMPEDDLAAWQQRIADGLRVDEGLQSDEIEVEPEVEPEDEHSAAGGEPAAAAAPAAEPPDTQFMVQCPQGHKLACGPELLGRKCKCPKCGQMFRVPRGDEEEAEEPADVELSVEEKPAKTPAARPKDAALDDFLKGIG